MIAHKWQPITALPGKFDYDFAEIDSLRRRWLDIKLKREAFNPNVYTTFLDRLIRSWAIETGIIEGLYTLDRGVTETLVIRGISADLIDQGATNKDPHELTAMLEDHQSAAFGVYAEIREGNPLTRSAIRQIHAVLTNSQPTYTVVDQFGNRFETQLHHGAFKTMPNNPTRPDCTTHEYCPPEHVDSELDNLLAWYGHYTQRAHRYHPLLTAAWLHHRFTQIHPFEDGNGRVVRTLLTWHLVRENYLPVVVNRDIRADYIEALETADNGDLVPLVDLLVSLQKKTILSALADSETYEQPSGIDEAVEYLVGRVNVLTANSIDEIQMANAVAHELSSHAADWMEQHARIICSRLGNAGHIVTSEVHRGGPGYDLLWYYNDLQASAQLHGYQISPDQPRFFAELSLRPFEITRHPHLMFTVLLYHFGQPFTGIMLANAFTTLEGYHDSFEPFSDEPIYAGAASWLIAGEPFAFTLDDDVELLLPRFKLWAEHKLAVALHEWGDRLG